MSSKFENQLHKLLVYLNDFPQNDWTKSKLLKFTDLEIIKKYANSNLKVLYYNRTYIEEFLYETEASITIDKFDLNLKSLYNLFYLDLLIMNNPDIINYIYSLDFIRNLNSFINKNNSGNQIQYIILLKVVNDLIKNYRGMDEYNDNEENEDNELNEIESKIKNLIPDNLNIGLTKDDIFSQKIDIIYAQIIFHFLKLKNFKEFESEIVNQMFLDNIYLTKDMLDKFCKLIDEGNKQDFIIEKIEDLSDINKINFYYILLKDILKKSFFIYQIPFLYKTRTIILNSIKKDLNELLSLKKDKEKFIQERVDYIILKLLDSQYYQNIFKFSKENSSQRVANSEYSTKVNSNNKNSKENFRSLSIYNEKESKTMLISNQSKSKSKNKSDIKDYSSNNKSDGNQNSFADDDEDDLSKKMNKSSELEIIEFIEIIKHNQTQFKKLSNNYYISGGKEKLHLYDSLYRKKTDIELDKDFPSSSSFYYINEINCDSSQIKLAIFCKIKYYVININLENFKADIKYFPSDLAMKSIFSIPNTENKYTITGIKGILNLTSDFSSQISVYNFNEKTSFIGGINLGNNTLALTSNSIIPSGEDKLILYNNSIERIKKEISGYSFRISSNCLSLIESEKDGKKTKILLCACKKYSKNQKNGILLVDLSKFNENEKTNELFYDTDYFEVDCFCPISIVENTNSREEITKEKNITITKTDFFFVGGFDEEKREGKIKLYKINYNNNNIDIEFIQDIINNDEKFEGFDRSITSIIQSDIIGNILVTSMDGNVYLFKPPNIDYLLYNDYL